VKRKPGSYRAGALLALALVMLGRVASAFPVRDLATLPTTPITDVVLGEPAFSPATTGYVGKHLTDLADFPFSADIDKIVLTTKNLLNEVDGKPATLIYRKPSDPSAKRRRPLTVYNYASISVVPLAKSIVVFEIPSRGLMMQFALVLKYHYKQKFHKDIKIVLNPYDPTFEDDAATKNYARLNAFFADAKQQKLNGIDFSKKFTLVFGYKKVIDGIWEPLTKEQELSFTSNGWVGTFYARKSTEKFEDQSDYIVTLDSDINNSYHVEVLAENIARLFKNNTITISHVVLAGSAGYIGNKENAPDKYQFIYPPLKLAAGGETYANPLGDDLLHRKRIRSQAEYLHTSVPSVLSETNAAMTDLRAGKITSVDMEFAYVKDLLVGLKAPVRLSIACLITDYPWEAPEGVRLAEKGDEEKKESEGQFAVDLGISLGALIEQ
jgi:hypothetical protein